MFLKKCSHLAPRATAWSNSSTSVWRHSELVRTIAIFAWASRGKRVLLSSGSRLQRDYWSADQHVHHHQLGTIWCAFSPSSFSPSLFVFHFQFQLWGMRWFYFSLLFLFHRQPTLQCAAESVVADYGRHRVCRAFILDHRRRLHVYRCALFLFSSFFLPFFLAIVVSFLGKHAITIRIIHILIFLSCFFGIWHHHSHHVYQSCSLSYRQRHWLGGQATRNQGAVWRRRRRGLEGRGENFPFFTFFPLSSFFLDFHFLHVLWF